jgi:hypothetical protein
VDPVSKRPKKVYDVSCSAEKKAKRILKQNPANLSLWNMYGQMILRFKGIAEGKTIYKTILELYPSLLNQTTCDSYRIHSSLAELQWADGDTTAAILSLLRLSDPKIIQVTGVAIVKSKKWFANQIDVISLPTQNQTCRLIESLLGLFYNALLLEILVNGIEAGVLFASEVIKLQESKSLVVERMFELVVKGVCICFKLSSSFKSSILRNLLELALYSFPHNTLFLTIYGWNEGKTKLDNRVRRFINEKIKMKPSQILTCFAVWTELHQRSTRSVQVIRAIVSESLRLRISKVSLQNWLLAISFEIKYGDLENAKSILYQSIASCPWSKGKLF